MNEDSDCLEEHLYIKIAIKFAIRTVYEIQESTQKLEGFNGMYWLEVLKHIKNYGSKN
jgi:hypothetical protein